jgi:hypothetical protein
LYFLKGSLYQAGIIRGQWPVIIFSCKHVPENPFSRPELAVSGKGIGESGESIVMT